MIFRQLAVFSFVLLGAALASGCGQGDGQVCQGGTSSTDCAAGLTCQCSLGGGPDARGICRPVGATCSVTTVDSNLPDVGPRDAGNDANDVDADIDADVDANATDADLMADVFTGIDGGTDGGTDANVDSSTDSGATDN